MIGEPLGDGFRLIELDEVGSTNDLVRRLAEDGEPEGLFVTAGRQTAGRGRQGRSWLSPPGNLYSSLLLRPAVPLQTAASLSLVVALAVAETVERLSGGRLRPAVKWPNDVLVDGAKIAGILLESSVDGGGRCAWVAVGVGVNLASSPGAGVSYPTANLAALGCGDVTPRAFIFAYAPLLRGRLAAWETGGFAALREAWLGRAARLGGRVEITLGQERRAGRFVGIDPSGSLLLESAPGRIERVTAGELVLG